MKKKIEQELNKIVIPKELHERSRMGIENARSEIKWGNKMNKYLKRIAGVAAAVVLSIGLIATNPTLANTIQGFFKDITNWHGAVTGTEYEQATEEIDIKISNIFTESNKVSLPMEVTFENSDKAPFNAIEALTLGDFKIVDSSGNEINYEEIQLESASKKENGFEINDADMLLTEMENQTLGKRSFVASFILSKEHLRSGGKYTLIINSFYGHKKADAPIEIKGNWKLDFSVE